MTGLESLAGVTDPHALLMSILMHASISSSALVFGQHYGSPADELWWTAGSVSLAIGVAVLVWELGRGEGRMAAPAEAAGTG